MKFYLLAQPFLKSYLHKVYGRLAALSWSKGVVAKLRDT